MIRSFLEQRVLAPIDHLCCHNHVERAKILRTFVRAAKRRNTLGAATVSMNPTGLGKYMVHA